MTGGCSECVPGCTCGFGGEHVDDNPRCRANWEATAIAAVDLIEGRRVVTGEAGPVPDDVQLNEFGDVYVLSITEEVPLGDKRWTVDESGPDLGLTWGNNNGHISLDWSSVEPRFWAEIYYGDAEALAALVADVQLATRVRSLAAPYEAGGPSDELRRTVAGLLAPFLDHNASPIVAADAVLATAGISDALARDAKVAEIVAKWASGRNEPWPLTGALEVADAIAALYPEAGK